MSWLAPSSSQYAVLCWQAPCGSQHHQLCHQDVQFLIQEPSHGSPVRELSPLSFPARSPIVPSLVLHCRSCILQNC